jgi:hypothetical protein
MQGYMTRPVHTALVSAALQIGPLEYSPRPLSSRLRARASVWFASNDSPAILRLSLECSNGIFQPRK